MKNVTAKDVVNFIKEHIIYRFSIPQTITTNEGSVFLAEEFKNKEHIIYRFGILQTITTDEGSVFLAEEFKKFAEEMGITLIQSSPYYA